MQQRRSEASPAARNTLDSAWIPRASKLLICGLFQKGRVLAQDGIQRDIDRFLTHYNLRYHEMIKAIAKKIPVWI